MTDTNPDLTLANPLVPVVALTAGVLSHLIFFHHGERHLYPFRYIQFYLLLLAIFTVARSHYLSTPTGLALKSNLLLFSIYFTGLYTSLLIFRLFFNPLNKIPGPYLTRLTKFAHVARNTSFNNNLKLLEWHQKYGQFVRIGPNDVSVTHPDGVHATSAPNTKCTKAQWYSQDLPLTSMHTTRDRATHDRRRRVWAPAFSDRALRGYESRIQRYNKLLLDSISAKQGQPLNMSLLFNHYSFDVMGDLAFGKPFDMLSSGETHWAIKLLNAGMDPMGLGLPPWFFRLLVAIPGAAGDYWKFIQFCSDRLMDRVKEQPAKRAAFEKSEKKSSKSDDKTATTDGGEQDITFTLIEQFEAMSETDKKTALPMLQGDSRLIIVAGSDTTAATLVHLFYYLAANPDSQQKLRDEFTSLVQTKNGVAIEHHKIQDAEYLNGCINEALRLNPPVPSGVFRNTPSEGIVIGDTFVPGNTCIQMPQYVMARDPTIYPSPTLFSPSRWLPSNIDTQVPRKDAFAPFSAGPYGCIGKNLALLEIRLLTAELITRFRVKLAEGEDGEELLYKSADHFTLGLGGCMLVFEGLKG